MDKDKIKTIIFSILVIAGFIFSCWLAIGVMLIGGIMTIVNGATGIALALAILEIIFFEMGFLPFWLSYILGWWILVYF